MIFVLEEIGERIISSVFSDIPIEMEQPRGNNPMSQQFSLIKILDTITVCVCIYIQ